MLSGLIVAGLMFLWVIAFYNVFPQSIVREYRSLSKELDSFAKQPTTETIRDTLAELRKRNDVISERFAIEQMFRCKLALVCVGIILLQRALYWLKLLMAEHYTSSFDWYLAASALPGDSQQRAHFLSSFAFMSSKVEFDLLIAQLREIIKKHGKGATPKAAPRL